MSLSRFGVVAVFLSLASLVGGSFDLTDFGVRAAVAWLMLVPFRVRDDLASLAYDRIHFPDRVLVRATSHQVFWAALLGFLLLVAGVLWVWRGVGYTAAWAGLFCFFEVSYRIQGQRAEERAWAHLWVLSKYPVLVWLLQPGALSIDLVLTGGVVYLTFAVFEILDTGALGYVPGARWALWGECTLAGVLGAFLLGRQLGVDSGTGLALATLVPWWGLALTATRLVNPHERGPKWAPISFGLAFVGLAWIVVNS